MITSEQIQDIVRLIKLPSCFQFITCNTYAVYILEKQFSKGANKFYADQCKSLKGIYNSSQFKLQFRQNFMCFDYRTLAKE
jgi:hypothetical protein